MTANHNLSISLRTEMWFGARFFQTLNCWVNTICLKCGNQQLVFLFFCSWKCPSSKHNIPYDSKSRRHGKESDESLLSRIRLFLMWKLRYLFRWDLILGFWSESFQTVRLNTFFLFFFYCVMNIVKYRFFFRRWMI